MGKSALTVGGELEVPGSSRPTVPATVRRKPTTGSPQIISPFLRCGKRGTLQRVGVGSVVWTISARLGSVGRSQPSLSREVARNGGAAAYRAHDTVGCTNLTGAKLLGATMKHLTVERVIGLIGSG